MKLPFWAMLVGVMAMGGAYYGQREATSIALSEIRGELAAVKVIMVRLDVDRYTGSDARRDLAWRDEKIIDINRRMVDLELEFRRRTSK